MQLISEFLTPLPVSVQPEDNLAQAWETMRLHRVRHLPVRWGTDLIGVVTERDLLKAMAARPDAWGAEKVHRIASKECVRVRLDAPAAEVLERMLNEGLDCALIEDYTGRLVGIFTERDGVKELVQFLHEGERHSTLEESPC